MTVEDVSGRQDKVMWIEGGKQAGRNREERLKDKKGRRKAEKTEVEMEG